MSSAYTTFCGLASVAVGFCVGYGTGSFLFGVAAGIALFILAPMK